MTENDGVVFFDDDNDNDSFEPIPNGTYVCTVAGVQQVKSSKKGTPGTKVTFRIAEGEHKGRQVWETFWHSPKALKLLKGFIRGGGEEAKEELIVNGEGGRTGIRIDEIADVMLGRTMSLDVTDGDEGYEEYKNVVPFSFRQAETADTPF